jgi:hypothetical protein
MADPTRLEEDESARAVARILAARGGAALQGRAPEAAARLWVENGFDDPEEVEAWLDARCPDAASARRLEEAGITPEQAAFRTNADGEETLGSRLARGELSLAEARRIITREFWND